MHDFSRVEQPPRVFWKAKDTSTPSITMVSAHTFENTATIVQSVGEQMYLGIAPIDQLTIHPNVSIAVRK
jgi:hypothetical protein